MTTITTHHAKRFIEPVCPPWCAGHDGAGYQNWYDTDDGGYRNHCSPSAHVAGFSVIATTVEDEEAHHLSPARVELSTDPLDRTGGHGTMTCAEARRLAAEIERASTLAEDWQNSRNATTETHR